MNQEENAMKLFAFDRAPIRPHQVTVFDCKGLPLARQVLALSLEGLRAKCCPDIYLLDQYPDTQSYLELIRDKYSLICREEPSLEQLLRDHLQAVKGYILCNLSTCYSELYQAETVTNDSLNVATSLSGLLGGLICDQSEEALMQELGLPLLFDARDKDIPWLLESEFYPQLNKNIAFESSHHISNVTASRDFMVMSSALCFFDEAGAHTAMRQKILTDLNDDCPLFGWGNGMKGEDGFIEPMTRTGHYCVCGLGCSNLTFHSAFADMQPLKQKNRGKPDVKAENGNHYLTILVSDGDNVHYAFNGLRFKGRNFDDPARGDVNIGWGIPSSFPLLAPDVQQHLYNSASDGTLPGKPGKDHFVTYSAGGYFYPSMYPRQLLEEHARKLNTSMKLSDTHIWGVIDFFQYQKESLPLWDIFTKQEQIDAIFYVDYTSYATDADYILWSNDKPVIASRARFWKDLPKSDIAYLADKFNHLPTDITNPNSYSLLMVHCWSRSLTEVSELVSRLDSHVKVVDPETFVRLIKENVDRSYEPEHGGSQITPKALHGVFDTGDFWPDLEERCENASVERNIATAYPTTNAPRGQAIASLYRVHGGRYEARLEEPLTLEPETELQFGIKAAQGKHGRVKISLYDEKDTIISEKELNLDFDEFHYFVQENLTDYRVTLNKVVLSSPDDVAFFLDECVFRGGKATPLYRRLLTDGTQHLTAGQPCEVRMQLTMTCFDEVNYSGAIFYQRREVDIEENVIYRLEATDDLLQLSGTAVTAQGRGETVLRCCADHYDTHSCRTVRVIAD